MVIEANEGPERCDDHRDAFAPAEALPLQVAVDDHQRIKADRAVVDEDPVVHLTDVDLLVRSARDQPRGFVEVGRNAKVAREMIERAEREDSEQRLGPDDSRGGGADRPVSATDDDQSIAAFGDRTATHRAVAA